MGLKLDELPRLTRSLVASRLSQKETQDRTTMRMQGM